MARATTYDGLMELLEQLFASEEESYRRFRPRPTDVIISPYAKCGTTWLQQIVHSVRTGGDMDFRDIYEVIPFIDAAIDLGLDLDADHRAEPRAFKSHYSFHEVPKGCRYLVSFRDPRDAVVSFYRFMEGWLLEPGAVPIDEVVARRALDRESGSDYWDHMASWLSQRDNPDVFLLTFEEMKTDLRGVIERIASFLELDADSARIDAAVHHSSFEFMSAHKEPFSERMLRGRSVALFGIPPNSNSTKIRQGKVGDHRHELSAETVKALDQIWADTIQAQFGYASYEDLVADLRGSR